MPLVGVGSNAASVLQDISISMKVIERDSLNIATMFVCLSSFACGKQCFELYESKHFDKQNVSLESTRFSANGLRDDLPNNKEITEHFSADYTMI